MSSETEKPWVKTYAGGKPNYTTPATCQENRQVATTDDETPPCKTHPDAPHGFDRNASHSADRYVCECESWEPPKKEWVGLTDEEFEEILRDFSHNPRLLAVEIEVRLTERNI